MEPEKIPPWRLFRAFLRLGLTAFGGPAMVAYIRELAVEKKQWLRAEDFQEGAALCQTLPGATAMQTAAFVGLRAGGPLGALAAFVGLGLPAFVLMVVASSVYQSGRDLSPVLAAFHGLHAIVIALIVHAAVNFGRAFIKNWRDGFLAAGAALFLSFHGSPLLAIAVAAGLGLLLYRNMALPAPRRPSPTQVPGFRLLGLAFLWTGIAAAGMVLLFRMNPGLFSLALVMAKVDLFAFGGGFASVPIMLHEVVGVREWLDARTFMDGIALGQITPGPIVITATFVGYQMAGLAGALVATVAIFSPSFLLVLAAVPFLDRLQNASAVRRVLRAILATFVGLLLATAVTFGMAVKWDLPVAALAVAALAALRLKVDMLWVVLAGGAVSVFLL
ncbi:MAG: chromate efflux transporter [Lentisphaerae bacterium]|nr:chromate efflux transporter [Lentisphaerota bacterium]